MNFMFCELSSFLVGYLLWSMGLLTLIVFILFNFLFHFPPDESMQKLFEGGKGSVFQRVLSWIPSNNHQLQLAGALAIANFARNGIYIHIYKLFLVHKVFCIFKFLLSITYSKNVQYRNVCVLFP